jgi:hypothetical protein
MPLSSLKTESVLEKALENINPLKQKATDVLWLRNTPSTDVDGTHSLRRIKRRIAKEVEKKEQEYHLKH